MIDDSANKVQADSIHNEQQNNEKEGINLVAVYRTLLRIVAKLEKSEYTENNSFLRQTAERELDELANPASDVNTPPG